MPSDRPEMTGAEAIAARLTPAQRKAIYPGPGNPLYAKGLARTISGLMARRLVLFGYRVAPLTPLGQEVRAVLAREPANG